MVSQESVGSAGDAKELPRLLALGGKAPVSRLLRRDGEGTAGREPRGLGCWRAVEEDEAPISPRQAADYHNNG